MKTPGNVIVIEVYKTYCICPVRSFNRGNKGKSGQQGLRGLQCLAVRQTDKVFSPALFSVDYNPNTMGGRTAALKKCRLFIDSLAES